MQVQCNRFFRIFMISVSFSGNHDSLAGHAINERLMRAPPFQEYALTDEPIDVVIPCHQNDAHMLDRVIIGIRSYGKNIRRVIVVSEKKLTDQAEWFDEAHYPFCKRDIALALFQGDAAVAQWYLRSEHNRIGWMYQQFLKLYVFKVIPHISSNVLVLDADTIFLNPVEFIDPQGKPLFNVGIESYSPYFEHAAKVVPGFKRAPGGYSGITHHMLFQKAVMDDLLGIIQRAHNTEPWRAICACIDMRQLYFSPFSEYEIYFNFIFSRSKQPRIRGLRWKDTGSIKSISLDQCKQEGYSYASCHSWKG